MVKRVLGIATAVALLGVVAYALVPDDPDPKPTPAAKTVTINGLIGSEKRAFFEDPAVKAELAKQGLIVNADSTGSWTMGDQASASPEKLDFAFPASGEPADAVKRAWKLQDSPVVPFYSPVVILTHQAAAVVLKNAGLAEQDEATKVWKFKMDEYVKAVNQGKRWDGLPGTEGHSELKDQILVTTTDPESSSSGAMFLALLSWAANGHQVVSDDAAVAKVAGLLNAATTRQGSLKSSTDEVFRNFTADVGQPLVFGYESQVAQLSLQGAPLKDTVVLYPDTTVHSDHTLVGRTDDGRRLGSLLRDDDVLVTLEAKYGFRPQKRPEAFGQETKGRQPQLAEDLKSANIGQAPVPSLEFLKKLTNVAKGVK